MLLKWAHIFLYPNVNVNRTQTVVRHRLFRVWLNLNFKKSFSSNSFNMNTLFLKIILLSFCFVYLLCIFCIVLFNKWFISPLITRIKFIFMLISLAPEISLCQYWLSNYKYPDMTVPSLSRNCSGASFFRQHSSASCLCNCIVTVNCWNRDSNCCQNKLHLNKELTLCSLV